ncbi:hypothetical protein [Bordetella muralis]|uniref:hypothetical protein n=1 Tax=Bordetella muralis TaxID=1649130 RepID=UPI0039F04EF9
MKDLPKPHKRAAGKGLAKGPGLLAKPSRPEMSPKDKSAVEHIKDLSEQLVNAQTLADTRLQEIVILSKIVFDLRKKIESSTQVVEPKLHKAQKRKLWGISSYFPRRVSSSHKNDLALLKQSPLFDKDWYLEKYPDVRESGIDPVWHYLKFGAKEGRNPGPKFNTSEYLRRNSGLAESGENPLIHYIKKNG